MNKIIKSENITVRRADERGHANHGWLDTYHTFSFADYYDPRHMGFRSLRVINEDRVAPGEGFGTHPHKDMEIITIVLAGALQHKDSMGNTSFIRPGEVQRMSAGSGVKHSEFNASAKEPVHLLQIWIVPSSKDLKPSYEQKSFPENKNALQLTVSADGRVGSLTIHQDARIYNGSLEKEHELTFPVEAGRGVWVQMTRGKIQINGAEVSEGDGVAVEQATALHLKASENAKFIVFDLA